MCVCVCSVGELMLGMWGAVKEYSDGTNACVACAGREHALADDMSVKVIGVDPATWGLTYVLLDSVTQRVLRVGEVCCQDLDQTATHRLSLLTAALDRLSTVFDDVRCVYVEQQPQHSGKAKQIAHWVGAFCAARGVRVRYVQPRDKYTGRFHCVDMSSLSGATAYMRKKQARLWMERELVSAIEEGTVIDVERSTMADVGDAVAIAAAGYALDLASSN